MNSYFVEFRFKDLKHQRCTIIVSDEPKEEIEKKIRDEFGEKITFLTVNLLSGNDDGKQSTEKQMTLEDDF